MSANQAHRVRITAAIAEAMELRTITPAGLAAAAWRKSSWSSYQANCVEVASLPGGLIGVRDSKDCRHGPMLVVSGTAWRAFVDEVKTPAGPERADGR